MPDASPENWTPFKMSLPPATFLILPAASTRAGIVSTYLLAFLLLSGRPASAVHEHDGWLRPLDLLARRLDRKELLHSIELHTPQHIEEKLEALTLIFTERVLLPVTAQTDAFPQMVE